MLVFSYGRGEFREGSSCFQGEIILSEHKLYLRGPEGDITRTYIPLEKIQKLKKNSQGLEIFVRLSLAVQYVALLKGDKEFFADLIKDLVARRGFKKKMFAREWFDPSSH